MKSFWVAYALHVVGGVLGLPHFYLGRNAQGLLYLVTGGMFLMGTARDWVRLRWYVHEANASERWTEVHERQKRRSPRGPPFSVQHWIAQYTMGMFFGGLVRRGVHGLAIDVDAALTGGAPVFQKCFDTSQPALVSAAGVVVYAVGLSYGQWLVRSVGVRACSLGRTVRDVSVAALVLHFTGNNLAHVKAGAVLVGLVSTHLSRRWRRRDEPPAVSGRHVLLVFAAFVFLFAKALDAPSDADDGALFENLSDASEMTMREARSLLGVGRHASPHDVKKAWRELSRQHHPDKVDAADAEQAADHHAMLNRAKELLTESKQKGDL